MKRVIPLVVITALSIMSMLSIAQPAKAEVVEKIYAVVNGEVLTYTEYNNAKAEMTRLLTQQYEGDRLQQELEKMNKELLDRLIEQKVIISFAKDENYDVDDQIELIIKNIKEENNIKSDEELRRAIASQGIDYQDWKKQLKENRIQQRYIYQEIGSKINIDNSAIMAYYKENIKEYTTPAMFTLNCIFLSKTNNTDEEALKKKREEITAELSNLKFVDVAKKYSELPGTENNYYLGEFKQGELDKALEKAAENLKADQHSQWVETDSGWYIIHMAKYVAPQLVEYKKVRQDIENKLRMKEQDVKLKDYLVKLKEQSHIKVYAESGNE